MTMMLGYSSVSGAAAMRKRIDGRRRRTGLAVVAGVCAAATLIATGSAFAGFRASSSARATSSARRSAASSAPFDLNNPVKTVSSTLEEFYSKYSQPPVLPMYRPYIVDLMSQTHLNIVDSRFKYDAIFALGLWDSYSGMMKNYDKLVGEGNTDKIWNAMVSAFGMDPEKVKADAEAMMEYAKSSSPAALLTHMEGTAEAAESRATEAYASIKSSLYNNVFSVGLFRMMTLAGVEVTKANVEEWAKALTLTPSKVASDLETWKQSQAKLQAAEEMLREVQIREKKKLAEKLEEKAKALSAKAAAKKEDK